MPLVISQSGVYVSFACYLNNGVRVQRARASTFCRAEPASGPAPVASRSVIMQRSASIMTATPCGSISFQENRNLCGKTLLQLGCEQSSLQSRERQRLPSVTRYIRYMRGRRERDDARIPNKAECRAPSSRHSAPHEKLQ